MKLLAVETSSSRGSLCLSEFDIDRTKSEQPSLKPIFITEETWEKQSSHSEVISEVLLRLLNSTSWQLKDLTHIAVGIGPGSFTGIRVGLNFAKSLAYALKLPIAGVNSLRILSADSLIQNLPVLAVVNAFKNQIFVAAYQASKELLAPTVLNLTELEKLIKQPYLGRGDGLSIYEKQFSESVLSHVKRGKGKDDLYPLASHIVKLIEHDQSLVMFSDWKSVNPLYIRSSSAEEKLKDGALKPMPRF